MRILIDPGHGGKDPGAVVDGVQEAHVAFCIAKHFYEVAPLQWQIEWSRGYEDDPSQRQRGKVARDMRADLSLHIHCDSSPNARAHGMRCYVWPGNDRAAQVAMAILGQAPDELFFTHEPTAAVSRLEWLALYKTIKGYWLGNARAVLKHPPCPSVLIECGFLSNNEDRAYLASTEGQRAVAEGIARAVSSWADQDIAAV